MSENLKRHYEPHLLNLVVSSDKNLTKINKFVPLPVESNPAQRVDWKERVGNEGRGELDRRGSKSGRFVRVSSARRKEGFGVRVHAFDGAIPTPRWSVSLRAPDSRQLTAADSRLSPR